MKIKNEIIKIIISLIIIYGITFIEYWLDGEFNLNAYLFGCLLATIFVVILSAVLIYRKSRK